MSRPQSSEILEFIDILAKTGSHYRLEGMEDLYLDDLGFLVLTPKQEVQSFSRSEMLAEFRTRRDAGAPPLSTEKLVLHIERTSSVCETLTSPMHIFQVVSGAVTYAVKLA